MKYDYLKGLAETAKEFEESKTRVFIEDFDDMVGHCSYCNARIRYKYHFLDPTHTDEEYGVGVCCARQLTKYIGLPEDLIKKIISFFNKYHKLCALAKVNPDKKIELKELEQKILELKRKTETEHQRRRREAQEEAQALLDKVLQIESKPFLLNSWEKNFIASCRQFITPRMKEILNKIYDRVVVHTPDLKNLEEIYMKLGFTISKGRYMIYEPIFEILEDINRRGGTLSEKQTALILKNFEIVDKRFPAGFEEYLRVQNSLLSRKVE